VKGTNPQFLRILSVFLLMLICAFASTPAVADDCEDEGCGSGDGEEAPDEQDLPEEDPCGAIDPDQPCYPSGGPATQHCTNSYGCLLCGMNQNLNGAVCYRLFGQSFGYCTCSAQGTYIDRWGIKRPKCKTSGICHIT
jgi:hypothetical protein